MKLYAKIRYGLGNIYWRIFQPITIGVKVVVSNDDGEVLLVKQSYQSYWSLPGGGVESGESSRKAAIREVREETGIDIRDDQISLFSVYFSKREHKSDHILLFVARVSNQRPTLASAEISEICWATPESWPSDISPATRRRLAEVDSGRSSSELW